VPHRLNSIEAILAAHSDVNDVMVIDYEGQAPILVLVKPEIICNGPELRDLCSAQLGAHGSRVIAVLVSELPSGEDDYPDPANALDSAYVYRYEPPVGDSERRLVSIWNEVLGRERTGVLDDFLDLGGDSMLAVRLINRVADELGATVDIVDFYNSPSVRAVATLVDAAQRSR
jgi:acyl carrier protein